MRIRFKITKGVIGTTLDKRLVAECMSDDCQTDIRRVSEEGVRCISTANRNSISAWFAKYSYGQRFRARVEDW